MADNYLEKRMEQHREAVKTPVAKPKHTLYSLIEKNRSTRLFDTSFVVREDQLRRIVAVNSRVASARNRQSLRFRLVTAAEAKQLLPFVTMGGSLSGLPLKGYEPGAFIVVCSTIEPRTSTYIDLGISVQSMLLQAVEIGLNGVCIMSFDKQQVTELLALPFEPLMIVAVGKSAERVKVVDINAGEDCSYYRSGEQHCVPKIVAADLIIE